MVKSNKSRSQPESSSGSDNKKENPQSRLTLGIFEMNACIWALSELCFLQLFGQSSNLCLYFGDFGSFFVSDIFFRHGFQLKGLKNKKIKK